MDNTQDAPDAIVLEAVFQTSKIEIKSIILKLIQGELSNEPRHRKPEGHGDGVFLFHHIKKERQVLPATDPMRLVLSQPLWQVFLQLFMHIVLHELRQAELHPLVHDPLQLPLHEPVPEQLNPHFATHPHAHEPEQEVQ